MHDITAYGATTNTDSTRAIEAAVSAATHSSGTVLIPSGLFLARSFALASGVTLEVNGTLRGLADEDVLSSWPVLPPLLTYGRDRDRAKPGRYRALVFADGARNIAIRGRGVIEGSGPWWWERRRTLRYGRPHLIEIANSSHIRIHGGLTLRDSGFWTVHLVYSQHVHVHDVTIRAPLYAPNTDGIDPDSSRDVLIERCDISAPRRATLASLSPPHHENTQVSCRTHVSAHGLEHTHTHTLSPACRNKHKHTSLCTPRAGCGDDHIAIKSGLSAAARDGFPTYLTEGVTIRHNTLRAGMGISIGSETSGGIRNVSVYANTFIGEGWSVALHVKSAAQRGRFVEDVTFADNEVYNTTGFMRIDTFGRSKLVDRSYAPTALRRIAWLRNRFTGPRDKRIRSKFRCPAGAACSDITVVNNTHDSAAGKATWQCEGISSSVVGGNSPGGLESCMRRRPKEKKGARQGEGRRKRRAGKHRERKAKGSASGRRHKRYRQFDWRTQMASWKQEDTEK